MLKKIAFAALSLASPIAFGASDGSKSVGLGLGLPYGGAGVNVEYQVMPNLYALGGFGSSGEVSAYAIGAGYYFKEYGVKWRPRATVFYGTNMGFQTQNAFGQDIGDPESFDGLTGAIGQTWYFGESKNHGFEFDLTYVLTSGDFDDRIKELESEGLVMEDDSDVSIS